MHWLVRLGVAAALVCSGAAVVAPAASEAAAPAVTAASATRAVAPSRGAPRRASRTFLTIPRLHARLRVRRGVSQRVLAKGPGYFPGTARPGEIGNMVILGHRTTHSAPFRRLHRLRRGDRLIVSARARRYVYRVDGKRIISARRRSVLAPVPFRPHAEPHARRLTLITCHPPGSDRQRLVVLARMGAR
ncbi:class E sortase [Actinomadura rubrobrunea]|uniref:class E sortase n=1 Tax=Actinomadura rubrobrunea TaxID=115335 RepID=UPI00082F8326|nr:class E sortase [Actinomadura rubrobrunea]